jgi:elongation factor 3
MLGVRRSYPSALLSLSRANFFSLRNGLIFDTLRSFSINKKSGYERESSAIAYTSLATLLGPALLPLLLQELPIILELLSDKGDVVREAATKALRTLVNLTNIEALESVFAVLAGHVAGTAPGASGKWKAKVGCLKEMARLVEKDWKGREQEAKDEIARLLSRHLPVVEAAMHDTKAEVSSAAVKTCTALFSTLPNPDLRPHIPVLLASLKTPTATQISATIKALSNTTFVSEVTSPSLAVLVPLLQRSLNDRGLGMDTLRRATVVTENVCKLVRDPDVAGRELSPLLNGVEKIMEGASFPEVCASMFKRLCLDSSLPQSSLQVRAFAASAHKTLIAVGASKTAPPPRAGLDPSTVVPGIKSLLPERLSAPSPFLIETLNFTASLIAPSVSDRLFTPAYKEKWHACLGIYMGLWLVPVPGEEDVKEDGGVKAGEKFGEDVRESFWALDRVRELSDRFRVLAQYYLFV